MYISSPHLQLKIAVCNQYFENLLIVQYYMYLSLIVIHKEQISFHAFYIFKIQHRLVVLQFWFNIYVIQHFCNLRSHSVLQAQP